MTNILQTTLWNEFSYEMFHISVQISLKLLSKSSVIKKSALVKVMWLDF